MQNLLKDISFKTEDRQLAKMFSIIAEEAAKLLNDKEQAHDRGYQPDITTTQYRKFYNKVLELSEKAKSLDESEFEIKVLPFIKMLNSKVQYSQSRGHCGHQFTKLMDISIKKVNSKEELQNFKYFLEAIIGFMPKK